MMDITIHQVVSGPAPNHLAGLLVLCGIVLALVIGWGLGRRRQRFYDDYRERRGYHDAGIARVSRALGITACRCPPGTPCPCVCHNPPRSAP